MEKIEELKKDIEELESLMNTATRSKVKDILSIESRKLATELVKLQETTTVPSKTKSTAQAQRRYEIKLTNYAWDQSDKFVKVYVNIPKVHTIPKENVSCNFMENEFTLTAKDVDNKDYTFSIHKLLEKVDASKSTWKIKTDTVLVSLMKCKTSSWSHITATDKKESDSQKVKPDESVDPSEGLMSLMKKMYEKGDDDMKRTIAQAWTESQGKANLG